MPVIPAIVWWVAGAGAVGFTAGALSDTKKMLTIGAVLGGGYYVYKKVS